MQYQTTRPNTVNTNFVTFFTMMSLTAALYSADKNQQTTPDLDYLQNEPAPLEKPIQQSFQVEGEEVIAEETIKRSDFIYPSNWGQAGIFRVRSAESLPDGALTFGIGGEFYSVDDTPNFGYGNTSASTIVESLFMGYSPLKDFTISMQRRNSSTTFGNPKRLISSLGDFNFSALYSFILSPSLSLAPVGNFLIASNFNDLAPAGSTLSAGIGLASTLSFYQLSNMPLFIHANVLYHMPQLRTTKTGPLDPEAFFGFSRFHTLTFGLGVEYKFGDIIPFIEYWHVAHTNSVLNFGNSPSKMSLGLRFTPLSNKSLAVLIGGDIGLTRKITSGVPYTPGYQILGQLSYTFGLHTTERKHYFTTKDVNVVDRKFVIGKRINFKIGKAELDPSSYQLLNQIAEVIKENGIKKLLIAGHTDSSHTEDYNLKLSLARANAVRAYLVTRGITDDTFTTQGFGKRKPRASNATETGRRENRRVEFFILE